MRATARATATTSTEAAPEALSVMRTASDYLGPARVLEVSGSAVSVSLSDGRAGRARMALAFPYRPAPGDTLLVVGREGELYVIGVLEGTGETVLAFPGGVELRAEGGPLRLASDQAVEVRAPEVAIDAGNLRLFAEAAVEKLGTLYRHVRGLYRARSGASETVVDEDAITRARSATILTDESMSINGKQIHLG
jgi:Protein of unknown function (DUF3540)